MEDLEKCQGMSRNNQILLKNGIINCVSNPQLSWNNDETDQTDQTDRHMEDWEGAAPTAAVIFKNQTKVITLENCPNFLNYHTVDMLRYTVEKKAS